jgi:hypothetical protein
MSEEKKPEAGAVRRLFNILEGDIDKDESEPEIEIVDNLDASCGDDCGCHEPVEDVYERAGFPMDIQTTEDVCYEALLYLGRTEEEVKEGYKRADEFPLFSNVYDFQDYKGVFQSGEMIVITPKIPGEHVRACIRADGQQVADGDEHCIEPTDIHWLPIRGEHHRNSLACLQNTQRRTRQAVVLYGVYNEQDGFVAHDVIVEGKYLGYTERRRLFEKFGVPHIKHVYRGPYSEGVVKTHTDKHEHGIVIRPVVEREHAETGRVILKSVNPPAHIPGDTDVY